MHHVDLTPSTPVADCVNLLQQPPGPWPEHWAGFPNVCEAFRQLFDTAASQAPSGQDKVWEADAGIVICGGGWRFFPSLYVTVRQIRATGCQLPIQIWYLGDRNEFDIRMAQALAPYDVGWICGNSYAREHGIPRRVMGGWELKPFAALHAPFRTVVCLDADSYPVYNPEEFLAHPEFQRVGAAFWPDQQPLEPGQWERFGLEHHNEPSFETGQYIIDKSRHYAPLWLTDWMNNYSDYVYRHIYGDKDTFHLCWRKLRHECCIPTGWAGWDQVAFLQMDFDGHVLFVHRTRDKFRWDGAMDGQPVNNWYMTGQWHGQPQFIASLPAEVACHKFYRQSSELLRPDLHFSFVDGPAGWCRAIWDEVCLAGEYKVPVNLPADSVVLDVGAHVGAFSRTCLNRGAGLVVAVEPMARNLIHLKHNLADLGTARSVVVNKAMWTHEGIIQLAPDPCHVPGNTSTVTLFMEGQGPSIQCTTPDSLIDLAASLALSGQVELMKVDAEGGEYSLLGCKNLSKVKAICAELHDNCPGYTPHQLIEFLTHEGFSIKTVKNGPCTLLLWASRQ